jgi:hypothetical protein
LRIVAALLSIQLVASTVGQDIHYERVGHVLCLQHGRIEHVHRRASQASPSLAPDVADGATGIAVGLDWSDDHDACGLLWVSRQQSLAACATATIPELPLAVTSEGIGSCTRPAQPAIPLLALAPKQSPPRS